MAEGIIDSLQIEIGTSSSDAVDSISKLSESLKQLKQAAKDLSGGTNDKIRGLAEALNSLGSAGKVSIPGKLPETISGLASSLQTLKSENIEMVKKLADAMKSLDGIQNIKIDSNLPDRIFNLAASVADIPDGSGERLGAIADALSKLSGEKISISSKVPESLREIGLAVWDLQDKAIARLDQVTEALARLKGIDLNGVSKAMKLSDEAVQPSKGKKSDMLTNMKSMSSDTVNAMSKIELLRMRLAALRQEMGKKMAFGQLDAKGIANAAIQIKNVQSQIENEIDKTDKAAKSALKKERQRRSRGTIALDSGSGRNAALASDLQAVGKALASSVLPGAKAFLSTLVKSKSVIGSILKNIRNGIGSLLKRIIQIPKSIAKFVAGKVKKWWDESSFHGLEKALKRINTIIRSFGRIAFYRAIRSAIKYVTDALKEGTENAYWYSREFGDATRYISEAYDEIASKNFKMSNQLGAAWSTLIAAIEPIILRIIELVTYAADAVTQFFAAMSGKTIYMHAIDYNKEWAESADDAASSAKEWKNQLMGFDEINRLEEPSGTSRGSGKELPDYGAMFEEVPVNDWFLELRKMFENGQWEELGQTLGNKFNELVNSVNWGEIGKSIGTKLNGAIVTAYTFLKTADFKDLGTKIAEFLNNAAEQINFNTLGRLVTRIKTAILDVLYGAVTGLNWGMMAKKLSDYFIGEMDEFTEWIKSLDPKAIAQSIKDFFGNIKYNEIAQSFKTLIKTAWEFAVSLSDELFPDGLVPTVTNAIKGFFEKIKWEDVKKTFSDGLGKLKEVFTNLLDYIWPEEKRNEMVEKLKTTISDLLKKAFESIDWATILSTAHNILSYKLDEAVFGEERAKKMWSKKGDFDGRDIILGMSDGIEAESQTLRDTLETNVNEPCNNTFLSCRIAAEDFQNGYGSMVSDVTGKSQEFNASMTLTKDGVVGDLNAMSTETSNTKTVMRSEFDEVSAGMADLRGSAAGEMGGISAEMANLAGNAQSSFGNIKVETNDVSNAMRDMAGEAGGAMSEMESEVSSSGSSIVSVLSSIASAARNAISAVGRFGDRVSSSNLDTFGLYATDPWNGYGSSSYGGKVKIRAHASGGFPEDGLFMANHGELVGRFSNGKTAVANNEQIVAGISRGVYEAMVAANSGDQGGSGRPVQASINVNGREFMRAVFDDYRAVAREHGVSLVTNGA